jgi:hypothetical protein
MPRDYYILSNNHVLANSNEAECGDAILQPGPFDGGRFPDDHLADLEAFTPIIFLDAPGEGRVGRGLVAALNAGCRLVRSTTRYRLVDERGVENRVDAAIARPLKPSWVSSDIVDLGTIAGLGSGRLGLAVTKSGRTTGLTSGEITQVDVSVDVEYGAGRRARFTDQLMAGPMSQGGDSGSAVLDSGNRLVGLLFAGSENSTVINRIEHVFSELGLTL